MKENFICPVCNRETPEIYQEHHHLIPKAKKGKETILVCVDCGDMIHQLIPLSELKNEYNTLEKLITFEPLIKWGKWANKKKSFKINMKSKKRKKQKKK